MAEKLSTKKAAAAAQAPQQPAQESSENTYLTMDDIPWDNLEQTFGIRRADFEGDSPMNKGRREALLSGNYTPTFDCRKSMDGITAEQTFSMRAAKILNEDGTLKDIFISLETPLHPSMKAERFFKNNELPEDVVKALAETGNAGRIVSIEERVFENGKPKVAVAASDITNKETGELIKAGTPLADFKTGKPLYETRKNSYFLSQNPYTRRTEGRLATKKLKDAIQLPKWIQEKADAGLLVKPMTDKQLESLKNGDAINIFYKMPDSGHIAFATLQYDANLGCVARQDSHPMVQNGKDTVQMYNEAYDRDHNINQEQSRGQSL